MTDDLKDRLASYDDRQLDPRERAELDRILDESEEAREYLGALRRDREEFRRAFAAIQARPGFADAVMARLPQRRVWVPLPRLLEACAVALFAFVIVTLVSPGRQLERQRQLLCQQQLRDLARLAQSYAQDYDDHLPDATAWATQLTRQYGPVDLFCPSDPDHSRPSYGMPIGLSGADIRKLDPRQVVLYDAEGLFLAPRHEQRANVGRLDGSVYLAGTESLLPALEDR